MDLSKTPLSLDVVWAGVSFVLAGIMFIELLRSPHPLPFAVMVLYLQAGYLFWIRESPRLEGVEWVTMGDVVAMLSVPSVLLYEINLDLATQRGLGNWIMLFGAALCFASTWSLGKSFGVLPRNRGVRRNGAYRLVRHPIYASFLVMDAGFLVGHLTPWNVGISVAGLLLIALRVYFEEQEFAKVEEYRDYCRSVRYRMIPGVV